MSEASNNVKGLFSGSSAICLFFSGWLYARFASLPVNKVTQVPTNASYIVRTSAVIFVVTVVCSFFSIAARPVSQMSTGTLVVLTLLSLALTGSIASVEFFRRLKATKPRARGDEGRQAPNAEQPQHMALPIPSAACPRCGESNPEDARFCGACAAPLSDVASSLPAIRKTVTVLFSDIGDSRTLTERLGPEALHRVMSRYFDEMRTTLEAHGGTVEKFIGDAIMAVFGVPSMHEDDALRAVRAADEMRKHVRRLNAELEDRWGVRLQVQTGISTGEVVVGDASGWASIVTGDVVHTAKRLEEAAEAGAVLVGPETFGLVRQAVQATPLKPLQVKGKSEPVPAWRIDEVKHGTEREVHRPKLPFVGRESELRLLREVLARVEEERSCRIVTVLGSPGLGKSRLVRELRARTPHARFLIGRCSPYGEGITFWSLAEIVREAGGDDALTEALAGSRDADVALKRLRAGPGGPGAPAVGEETVSAVRKLFEALAREQPLVVCFEDAHWAEPGLLDVIEYLARCIRDVPVLLICLARPDLLETRPSWAVPQPGRTILELQPLPEPDAQELVALLGTDRLSEQAQVRIVETAEGNPLFLEQLVAVQASGEPETLPPSVQAVLAARIDRLEPGERAVLAHASVEGRTFHLGALATILPPSPREALVTHLMALVRKQLIRPSPPDFPGEDGFRFTHALIRDAAYAALPKRLRAELHEAMADWFEAKPESQDEIVGYHLEQAYLLRAELGLLDAESRRLGERAAVALGAAGRRALAREDISAAFGLIDRALALDPTPLELQRELSYAVWTLGEVAPSESLLTR
jgi:class 3 adenylate cyclase